MTKPRAVRLPVLTDLATLTGPRGSELITKLSPDEREQLRAVTALLAPLDARALEAAIDKVSSTPKAHAKAARKDERP